MCDGMKTVVQEHGEEDEHARDRISNAHSPLLVLLVLLSVCRRSESSVRPLALPLSALCTPSHSSAVRHWFR